MTVTVDAAGSSKVPESWWMKTKINMQRLYYIKGGKGYVNLPDGNKLPFEKGKLYLHPYNLAADFVSDKDEPLDHLYFDFLSSPAIVSPRQCVYESSPSLMSLIDTAEVCLENHPFTENGELYRALLEGMLMLLDMQSPLPTVDDEVIVRALNICEHHYGETLSVTDIARRSGFETNYFIRRFKKAMGVTPYAYLKTLRLIKARALISRGCTLSAAAREVGYENASSLARALKGRR